MAATPVYCRKRVVVPALGTATQSVKVPGAPKSGILRRVRATIASAQDAQASIGTGPSTDMAIAVGEGSSAAGLGGVSQQAIVYSAPLGTPRTTLDAAPNAFYQVASDQDLRVFVATNADKIGGGGDATMVVTLDIEITNMGV